MPCYFSFSFLFFLFFLIIGCDKPLGLQNGWVQNSQMTASSAWTKTHAAWRARLFTPKQYSFPGAWCSRYINTNQWIQVKPKAISSWQLFDDDNITSSVNKVRKVYVTSLLRFIHTPGVYTPRPYIYNLLRGITWYVHIWYNTTV